jgi:serine protease Do
MGLVGALAVGPLAASGAPAPVATLESWRRSLFDRTAPEVVLVTDGTALGSAFAVAPGCLVTSAHVVGRHRLVRVVSNGGEKLRAEVVQRGRHGSDVALLRVRGLKSRGLRVGDPRELHVGSWVGVVGHGAGAHWSFNTGMVSNIYHDDKGRSVIQTQIPLNPGSSGAPVLNSDGEVVGIVTAGIVRANAINFAVPIDLALTALPRLSSRWGPLVILAPPGARVLLDGALVGVGRRVAAPTTPGRHRVEVVAGHRLRAVAVFYPHRRRVDLRAGR